MAERKKIEGVIRDWLSENLDFLEDSLELIQKEYYLTDEVGARGFVDLLCKDDLGNFVIIEIKRSDSSARQTISEVLKYHALIRHNCGARESEIRTIIISTHWNELIRPFSEVIHRTSLALTGYHLQIDEQSYLPLSIKTVVPLEKQLLSRKFAYWQSLYLFEKEKDRDAFFVEFEKRMAKSSFKDFVLVKLVGPLDDQRIIFPWAVIYAFQKMPVSELIFAIEHSNQTFGYELYPLQDYESEAEYVEYLELEYINHLDDQGYSYESEDCYPGKVSSMLNAEGWSVEFVSRSGIFDKDPRYSEEMLIEELKGMDGNNENSFWGIAESNQVERIKEIYEECQNSLAHAPGWLDFITSVITALNSTNRRFRITLVIFNPVSLMTSIFHSVRLLEYNYLPAYHLAVEFLDEGITELYRGDLYWNGEQPTSKFLKPFPKNEKGNSVFRLYLRPSNLKDSVEMQLYYRNVKYDITNNGDTQRAFVNFDEGEIKVDENKYFSFSNYHFVFSLELDQLVENYLRSYVNMYSDSERG